MEIEKFKDELKKVNAIPLDDYLLFNDLELYNLITGVSKQFEDFNTLLNHKIRGVRVEEMIKGIDAITYGLAGGRGSSGGSGTGSLFGGQNNGDGLKKGRKGKGNSKEYDLPARMNKMYKGNKMSFNNTLKNFKKVHLTSDSESAVTVDSSGFVSIYKHGSASSVGWYRNELEGKHVIHNHPSHGYSAFSKADLITTATTGATGITATSKQYDYILNKKHNFDAKGFVKAVNKAQGKTGDYNKDVHDFLKSNAKKYGYSYSRKSNSKLVKN